MENLENLIKGAGLADVIGNKKNPTRTYYVLDYFI